MGLAANSRWHGLASSRAIRTDRAVRAESVAMPVFAYIWRYSFEIRTNAILARMIRPLVIAPRSGQRIEAIPDTLRELADLVGRHHRMR